MSIPHAHGELMARQGGLRSVFQEYELLVAKADAAFRQVAREWVDLVNCRAGCYDCCQAVFGVFPVESVYLGYHFQALAAERKREAVARAEQFDRELAAIQERYGNGNPDDLAAGLARERVRCPLLGPDRRCLLYGSRPLTCRVYGIPTVIRGRSHVCGKSGFPKGGTFPAFNLDLVNRELYRLSGRLLETHGNPEAASSVLYAVSRSLQPDLWELMKAGGIQV